MDARMQDLISLNGNVAGKRYQKEVVKLRRYNFEKDVEDDGDDNKTNCNAQRLLTMILFTFLIPDQSNINWYASDCKCRTNIEGEFL